MPADLSRARDLANAATTAYQYGVAGTSPENVTGLSVDDVLHMQHEAVALVPDLLDEVEQLRTVVRRQERSIEGYESSTRQQDQVEAERDAAVATLNAVRAVLATAEGLARLVAKVDPANSDAVLAVVADLRAVLDRQEQQP